MSFRKLLRPASITSATCVGACSRSALSSIVVNPYAAFVGVPRVVERCGIAW